MASETRPTPDSMNADSANADPMSILQPLLRDPHSYDFFEALRRIECAWPTAPRLGTAVRPDDEPVRLGQKASLAFPTSMLAGIEANREGRLRIETLFMGLFGSNGALPLHLTDYVHDRRINASDTTLQAFSDLFQHRMLASFYRAWASARPTVQFDRPESDRFATYLAALIGRLSPALQERDTWPDRAKLFFAGVLAAGTKTRVGLELILRSYFELPVRVEECVGEWLAISADERARLGDPRTATLGRTILGARVWGVQHKIRVVLGPLEAQQLLRFLPGMPSLRRLRDAVRNYLGLEYAWDLQLVVERARVPGTRLGTFGQLGWTTWSAPAQFEAEAGDVIINVCDEDLVAETQGRQDG